jgi:hypothetical protein
MGQATLDLPDPTQMSGVNAGPLSPEALASADDLLSQLAGDDIDRLLAEAEADRPPVAVAAPVVATPPPAPAVVNATAETATQDTAAVDGAAAAAAELDALLAPAIDSSTRAAEDQLDEVLRTIDDATPTPTVTPAVEAAGVVAQEASVEALDQKLLNEAAAHVASIMDIPEVLPPATTGATTSAQSTESAERQALADPLIALQSGGENPGRLSLLVRILEWINSPMLLLPHPVRDAIGKVALLTTFNAAAVIVYVLVFRRPHH